MKDNEVLKPASKRRSRQTRIAQKLKRGKFSTRWVSSNQKRQSRKILLFCVGFHVALLLLLASFSIGSVLLDQDFTIVAVFGTELTEEVVPEVPIEVVDDFDADDDVASGAESPEMDSAAAETEVVEKEDAPVEDTPPVAALAALMSDSALEDVGGSGGTGSEGNGTGSGRGLLFPTMPRPEGKPNNSVTDGLAWLVDVQHRDGYWSFQRTGRESTMGSVDCNLAATGLAVLCLTKAGVDDEDLPYSNHETEEAKAEGLQWLLEATRAEVDTAAPVGGDFVSYGLPIAVLALAEEFLGDPFNDNVRDVLEGAVRTLESWQGVESGGWGYDPNEANLSVTVWTTLALNAAQDAGIRLKRRTIPAANYYVMSLEDEANLAFRYRRMQGTTPAMTAGGTLCRMMYLAGGELGRTDFTRFDLSRTGGFSFAYRLTSNSILGCECSPKVGRTKGLFWRNTMLRAKSSRNLDAWMDDIERMVGSHVFASARQFRGGRLESVVYGREVPVGRLRDDRCWYLFQTFNDSEFHVQIDGDCPLLGPPIKMSFSASQPPEKLSEDFTSKHGRKLYQRLVPQIEEHGSALVTLLRHTESSPMNSQLLKFIWKSGVRQNSTQYPLHASKEYRRLYGISDKEFYWSLPRFTDEADWFELYRSGSTSFFGRFGRTFQLRNLDSIIDPFLDRFDVKEDN